MLLNCDSVSSIVSTLDFAWGAVEAGSLASAQSEVMQMLFRRLNGTMPRRYKLDIPRSLSLAEIAA